MNVLSLCSGIGGLDIGVRCATNNAARTVALIEREGFCASVLRARMESGHLDEAVIFSDLKLFDGRPWRGIVDLIIGGYPCMPFSLAGRRKGKNDPRHLWPYIAELIATIEPAACFFENVPGHLTLGFEQVCEDLSAMGYSIEAGIYSAEECGAPHRRERLFFFAYAHGQRVWNESNGERKRTGKAGANVASADGISLAVADANSKRCKQGRPKSAIHGGRCGTDCICRGQAFITMADANSEGQSQQGGLIGKVGRRSGDGSARQIVKPMGMPADGPSDLVAHIARGWPADWEDGVPRTTEGEAHRIDKLRALGNAVVPATAAKAFAELSRRAGFNWCD